MARKRKLSPATKASIRRKRPGRTPKPGETVTIKAKGKKPLKFEKGALHRALNVPMDKPIPPSKKRAALEGKYGKEVKKMAVFAFKGALKKGRETAAAHRRKRKK